MNHDDERLEWLRSYAEGTAAPETLAALERSFREDGRFRDLFLEYLNVDLALATPRGFAAATGVSVLPTKPRVPRRRLPVLAGLCLAMAAAAVLSTGRLQPAATVTRAIGSGDLVAGDVVRTAPCAIDSGLVELLTATGVTVVIEAPARFHFAAAQRLVVSRGRVAADVPPTAKGFTVVTPGGDAVDLGTRFGVDVPETGLPEIHVLAGQVLARSPRSGVTSLEAGQATVFDRGRSVSRSLRSSAFIEAVEASALAAAVSAGQQAMATDIVERLRRDPDLIALLDFEERGGHPTCRIVQGRWPGSRAAEFVEVGDHLPANIGAGGSWPRLTMAAWVRLDKLGDPYHSLYHTDGWTQDNPGQVHWMITRNGTMRLALKGMTLAADARERDLYPESLTPVFGSQGGWVHLAAVYDASSRRARFYVDGRLDGESRLEVAPAARLGLARIGNWSDHDRKLSGRIDDMLFVGRIMGDEEIATLHAAGTPYR